MLKPVSLILSLLILFQIIKHRETIHQTYKVGVALHQLQVSENKLEALSNLVKVVSR